MREYVSYWSAMIKSASIRMRKKNGLEAEGMTVKRFDVRGSAQTVLFRAGSGSFFGDEKQAERVIRERSGRLAAFENTNANIRVGRQVLILMAIRITI
ncbi:hypothetical protein [Sutterella wadsworthensis]|jgi:hypothetical protein|uniref:hypothetical protein n=1 Tax=Sutterella wadsworthensis TaxID=40545 RepID=UPI0039675B32